MSDRNSIQKYYEKKLSIPGELPKEKKSYRDKFLELSYVNDPVNRNNILFGICLSLRFKSNLFLLAGSSTFFLSAAL